LFRKVSHQLVRFLHPKELNSGTAFQFGFTAAACTTASAANIPWSDETIGGGQADQSVRWMANSQYEHAVQHSRKKTWFSVKQRQ
jgi:hypothetical protein